MQNFQESPRNFFAYVGANQGMQPDKMSYWTEWRKIWPSQNKQTADQFTLSFFPQVAQSAPC